MPYACGAGGGLGLEEERDTCLSQGVTLPPQLLHIIADIGPDSDVLRRNDIIQCEKCSR